ncbi:MAG: type 1 glutamine amidotransferase [Lysobacteraceae bacterium]
MIPSRLTVVQHHPDEGPGRIAAWASRRGIALDIVARHAGAPLDAPADGVIVLGGPESAIAPQGAFAEELAWLRRIVRERPALPVLGICLGAQLLARALGGQVGRAACAEVGWSAVTIIDGAESSTLRVLQWHEDAFTVPPGATMIAVGTGHPVQGFRHGSRVGLQFHPEWDDALVSALHRGDPDCPLGTAPAVLEHATVAVWFEGFLDRWVAG